MSATARSRYYTVEQIGPNRAKTPEGYLLCRDVPIARTGIQVYGPTETPIGPGPDGMVYIERPAEEVFRPETIASFEAKSITLDHPEDGVLPLTWKEHTVGVVMNLRRHEDVLLADLLICDAAAIQAVEDGREEVSCGYDADTDEIGVGRGRQSNIVGNHVALVTKGRCGSRCALGDSAGGRRGSTIMATLKERVRKFLKDAGLADDKITGAEALLPEENSGETTHVHLHVGDADPDEGGETAEDIREEIAEHEEKIEELEERLEAKTGDKKNADRKGKRMRDGKRTGNSDEETEEERKERERKKREEEERKKRTDDEAAEEIEDEDEAEESKKTKDSAYLDSPFQAVVARAEVMVPGIRVSTFDAKADKRTTLDSMTALRRKALTKFVADEDNADVVQRFAGRRLTAERLKTMDAPSVKMLFDSIGSMLEMGNTAAAGRGDRMVRDSGGQQQQAGYNPPSPAELNKQNQARWARK